MTDVPSTADRAGSLGLILRVFSAEPVLPAQEALDASWALLGPDELGALQRPTSPDELALANACVALEWEIRAKDWQALERVLAAHVGRDLCWPEDRSKLADVARAAFRLGWLSEPPADPVPPRRPRACAWRRRAARRARTGSRRRGS